MAILVTGGAGYIGSHMVRALLRANRDVLILDDLSTGHRDAIPAGVPFIHGDVGNRALVGAVLRTYGVHAIVHFAARSQVGESTRDPRRYYTGNLGATIALLEAALDARVKAFVLSSTAAVYGIPRVVPIREDALTEPINPYGETKLAIERVLSNYARAYGLRYAALRYFNAAGAEAGLGERHEPESHLLPLVLDAALGIRPDVAVFGGDYPTADGTCVRDYVHVSDLADAHLAALDHLSSGGQSGPYNLGAGRGYSVNEVIDVCRAVTGRPIAVRYVGRRDGDPPVLVASSETARIHLGWSPRRSSMDRIVRDAWAWHGRKATARARSASSFTSRPEKDATHVP